MTEPFFKFGALAVLGLREGTHESSKGCSPLCRGQGLMQGRGGHDGEQSRYIIL